MEDAFFSGERFDRNRTFQKPEYEYSRKAGTQTYYVIGVDVGRTNCPSVAVVLKVNPQPMGGSNKSVVAIYTKTATHF